MPSNPAMVDWYERKTSFLLDKYGPGPRVHYHTGLVPRSLAPAADFAGLRAQIVESQEEMLRRACAVWDAPATLAGRVVDVGCGLGGTSIALAMEYSRAVTALTPIPGHVAIVREFTAKAGVTAKVSVELGDAHELAGEARFDAAVAMGASNYFDRRRWFARLAGLLTAGGSVCVEDTFLERDELAKPFNSYWISNVGRLAEYDEAARAAGFSRVALEDVTAEAAGFWRLSAAWSELQLARASSAEDIADRRRSIDWQRAFFDAYESRGFRNLLVRWRK